MDVTPLQEDVHETRRLARAIGPLGNVAIALSFLTPATSVFLTASVLLGEQGSASFLIFGVAGIAAFAFALCFAELGAMYPLVGGLYSIVARVLGKPLGFVALILLIVEVAFIASATALGVAKYLGAAIGGLNAQLIGVFAMLAATAIAVLGIRLNAFVVGAFLALELAALAIVVLLGFTHPEQPASLLLHPQVAVDGAHLATVSFGVIVTGITIALFAYEGYGTAVVFAEETRGRRRGIGRAVVTVVVVAVIAEILPVTAAIIGAPSLLALQSAEAPLLYSVESAGGHTITVVVSLGVALAMFNAVIAAILVLARIVYSSARDQAWPAPASRVLGYLHPRLRTPAVATVGLGLGCAVLDAVSSIAAIVTFTAVLVLFLYALLSGAAIMSRLSRPIATRPYRMPFWPLPPLVGLLTVGVAISKQSIRDIAIVCAIMIGATVYWLTYLRPRPARWVLDDAADMADNDALEVTRA